MKALRTFYLLLVTQVISLIGSRMTGIAIGIWVYAQTGDSAPILLAMFFAELPQMLLGAFGGILADKWNRRLVIVLGDAGQALGTIILLITISTGIFELWHLYLAMLIQGIFATLQSPAAEASIALLVPESQLDRANGLRQIGFPLAGVVAPAFAGVLYGLAGLEAVILVDLISFCIAVSVVLLLPIPQAEQSAEGQAASENLWTEVFAGWIFLQKRPALLLTSLYLAFVFFLINGPLDLAIPYLSNFTEHESTVGLLIAMMSLGAFAGASAVAIFGKIPHRMLVLLGGYLLHGIMLMLYGVTRNIWFIGAILFFLMFPLPLCGALFSSIIQTKTPHDMQGRVFAATGQLFTLTTPFSFLLTAWLVDHILEPAIATPAWTALTPLVGAEKGAGMGFLLFAIGLMIVIATLIMVALRDVRNLETTLKVSTSSAE